MVGTVGGPLMFVIVGPAKPAEDHLCVRTKLVYIVTSHGHPFPKETGGKSNNDVAIKLLIYYIRIPKDNL